MPPCWGILLTGMEGLQPQCQSSVEVYVQVNTEGCCSHRRWTHRHKLQIDDQTRTAWMTRSGTPLLSGTAAVSASDTHWVRWHRLSCGPERTVCWSRIYTLDMRSMYLEARFWSWVLRSLVIYWPSSVIPTGPTHVKTGNWIKGPELKTYVTDV